MIGGPEHNQPINAQLRLQTDLDARLKAVHKFVCHGKQAKTLPAHLESYDQCFRPLGNIAKQCFLDEGFP
jgi:hypothetical protein